MKAAWHQAGGLFYRVLRGGEPVFSMISEKIFSTCLTLKNPVAINGSSSIAPLDSSRPVELKAAQSKSVQSGACDQGHTSNTRPSSDNRICVDHWKERFVLMKWTLMNHFLRTSAFFALCAISTIAQAVTVSAPTLTVQPGTNGTMTVPISITAGNENLAGAEFAFQVLDPSGKITTTGLNLRAAGTIFGSPTNAAQQGTELRNEVRTGEFAEAFRQVVTNVDDSTDPPTKVFVNLNGTGTIAVATIKLTNPAPGVYPILINQTTLTPFKTRIADDSADDATVNDVQFINGSITVVPEPSTILMAGVAGLGLVVFGFLRNRLAA
jgi:hypothetical protein